MLTVCQDAKYLSDKLSLHSSALKAPLLKILKVLKVTLESISEVLSCINIKCSRVFFVNSSLVVPTMKKIHNE